MGFTEKQQRVIDIDEGNVVVSASAGSGKTSVMIERIIRLLIERKADISQILAVTFTNASAKEIRERVIKAMKDKIAQGENKSLFIEQIEKMPTASISTIHSFCIDLIRTYFFVAEVDPAFRVLDETESKYFKSNAVNEVFESLYDADDQSFILLLKAFIKSRDDKELKRQILNAYALISSEESFDDFFEKSLFYYTEKGFEIVDNRLIDEYFRLILSFQYSVSALKEYAENYNIEKYVAYFENVENEFRSRVVEGDIFSTLNNLQLFKIDARPRVSDVDKFIKDAIGDAFTQIKDDLKKVVEKATEIFAQPKDERLRKTLETYKFAKAFIDVVKLFKEKYDGVKRDACALDFNDLERFALVILQNEEIRQEVSSKYKYIFVDEYQDTNGVQEAIFSKIANDNLFIVGDVKQSIYSFRGCNPNIFNEKIESCATGYGEHIDLDSNFRSVKEVINATNKVFSGSMRKSTSGVEYSENKMTGSALYGDSLGLVKLHIAPKIDEEKMEIKGVYSVKKHEENIKAVAVDTETKTICDIIEDELFGDNGAPRKIYDAKKKVEREITYGDICVLTRAKKGISDRILSELLARSIPVICENKRPIGEYPEIKMMCNLLKFIISPCEDIALATVLKSGIGGFSDEELSTVRNAINDGNFSYACENYAKNYNDSISNKLNEFFAFFEKVRTLAQFDTASRTLKMITTESGYELKLLSTKLGELKLQRVNRFILAGENKTVLEMNSQIEGIIESLTVNQAQGVNAVKIMSYHSSKGLEFPVVVLADICKKFNVSDIKNEIYYDRDFGVGLKYYDIERKISMPTVLRELLELKLKFNSSTDELRLFYVAMTRARNKLHLVATKEPNIIRTFNSYALAGKMLDFINFCDLEIAEVVNASEKEKLDRRPVIIGKADEDLVDKISKYISFEYPYMQDTCLHLKRTVTEVNAKPIEVFNGDDFSSSENYLPITVEDRENLQKIGTAYHRFLETCDFGKNVDNELIRLYNENLLSKEQFDLIDKSVLNKILSLDIFQQIKGYKLYREQPFILNAEPKELGLSGNDFVLLQGVIDLLAVNENGALVIDYKYSSKSDDKLIETYRKQLDLYAYATEKILKKQVGGKFIVNLKLGRVIKC